MAELVSQGVISIAADVKEGVELLQELNIKKKTISKAILRTVGTGGKQAIRKGYRETLRKRTGKLYKSIRSYVYKNGTKVVFTNDADSGKPTSKDGRLARYGFMLASGYTIQRKDNKPLHFQVDGKWVSAMSVRVRPRNWVEPSLMRFVNSHDCEARIDKVLQQQIDRFEKKMMKGGNA